MICMFSVDTFTRQSQHACILRVWNADTCDEKKKKCWPVKNANASLCGSFGNVHAFALRKPIVCKAREILISVLCRCNQPPLYHKKPLVCCMPYTAFDSSTLPLCVFLFLCVVCSFSLQPLFVSSYCTLFHSRCERLNCIQGSECLALPVRITHYHLTFPVNVRTPVNIFRMGPSSVFSGDQIDISIVEGNEEGYFGTQKVATGGVMFVQRPIEKPKDFDLSLELKLIRQGMLSTYKAKVRVFVTEDQPSLPDTVTPN